MPTILPVSDLRNYSEVLNSVDANETVYLTRNGRGAYVISRLDNYSKEDTIEDLIEEIKKGENSLKHVKTISIEEVAKKFDVKL
jgi:PHD/YefM family antitoxin component YafN of YafNO toxin-antitoxin module